jgi:hypothetical protein
LYTFADEPGVRWFRIRRIVALLVCGMASAVGAAQLRDATMSNRFRFNLLAETNSIYAIQQSTNLVNWTEVARSYEFGTNRVVSFSNNLPRAFFRAHRTNESLFQFALAAVETIDLAGYNVAADSFDSFDPIKSTNNRYDVAKRSDNGGCSAPQGVTNSGAAFGPGNLSIWGKVARAPLARLDLGGSSKVGSSAWMSDPSTSGVQPGAATNEVNMKFPELAPPFTTNGLQPIRNMAIGGVTYDWTMMGGYQRDYAIPAGQTYSGKTYVTGNARLYVGPSSTINLRASDIIMLATNASLQIFVDCTNAFFGGNGIVNPGTATNFMCFSTARNTNFTYAGNAAFTGVFYAPAADFLATGGGASQIDFSGAVVARRIKMGGNYSFHFDEHLLRAGPKR